MSNWLDTVGSIIISSMVILLITGLNLQIFSSSIEKFSENYTQMYMGTTSKIIENAEPNKILFQAGLVNDSTSHTYLYYLGSTDQMSQTQNPNDRPLYRQEDSDAVSTVGIVTDFTLTYFDSTGTQINYGSLNSQHWRDQIRSIEVYLKIESPDPINGSYQAIEWEKTFRPKNLR